MRRWPGAFLRRLAAVLSVAVWCCPRCWRRQPYGARCVECGSGDLFPVEAAA